MPPTRPPYPCVEATIDLYLPGQVHVRIWRDATLGPAGDTTPEQQLAEAVEPNARTRLIAAIREFWPAEITRGHRSATDEDCAAVVTIVTQQPGVNAVQVLAAPNPEESTRFGVMAYTVPF